MADHRKPIRIITMLIVILLTSCPVQLEDNMYLQIKDANEPEILISSPEEGSSYAATVIVSGTVTDSATDEGDSGRVSSLSYEVLGTGISAPVDMEETGDFTFSFETTNLSGSLTIQLTALDWNGNESRKTLLLTDEGAIPSFAASSGNHEVTLTWDPVDVAASYTVYYETTNSVPSEIMTPSDQTITHARSGITIGGLENGKIHTFILKAESSEGGDNWSEVIRVIPLSNAQLAPEISSYQDSLYIEWNSLMDATDYEVWKSASRTGTYLNVSGSISGDSFLDEAVVPGRDYFYKIRPASYDCSFSIINSGRLPELTVINRRERSHVDTAETARAIDIAGDYAYIADSVGGLAIIDISDKDNPFETGYFDIAGNPTVRDVTINGDYAYLSLRSDGLKIIDISDPSKPTEVFHMERDSDNDFRSIHSIAVKGDYAYAADEEEGLHVIDISDPSNPVLKNTVSLDYEGWDIQIVGDIAYMTFYYYTFATVDISNPLEPVLMDNIIINGAEGLYIKDDYAYVSAYGENGLSIIEISDPYDLQKIGSYDTSGNVYNVTVDDDSAYLCTSEDGMTIVDISDPAAPVFSTVVDMPGYCYDAFLLENLMYTVNGSYGLCYFDITEYDTITEVGSRLDIPSAHNILIEGEYAYVADCPNNLVVVDISDCGNPQILRTFSFEEESTHSYRSIVEINGSYVYMADDTQESYLVIDISDPADPKEIGEYDAHGGPFDFSISGNHALFSNASNGLSIIDISDPYAPEDITTIDFDANNHSSQLRGTMLYANDNSDFRIYDISDIDFPTLRGSLTLPSSARDIQLKDDLAYIADYDSGLRILDISDTGNPVEIGFCDTPGTALRLEIHGDYAYLADGAGGIQIIDISDSENPFIWKSYTTGLTNVTDIAVKGLNLFVADFETGFKIFALSEE